MGPHASVAYPCGPTRPNCPYPCGPHSLAQNLHAYVICSCRPKRQYGTHGHTQATTHPCAAHGHAFIDHTAVSRIRPTPRAATRQCGVNSPIF
ncbi:hypothetical protein PVK06_026761 [Gossypium arboreum]|uniref:Uncharacterized protein n=1 Tax=Gossypium arboreum TaxID=29729 RepID=A0ABR0NYI6_GOSAR|nr:hypothetical protein PVK06_026761 [Gossypium arboreum]